MSTLLNCITYNVGLFRATERHRTQPHKATQPFGNAYIVLYKICFFFFKAHNSLLDNSLFFRTTRHKMVECAET